MPLIAGKFSLFLTRWRKRKLFGVLWFNIKKAFASEWTSPLNDHSSGLWRNFEIFFYLKLVKNWFESLKSNICASVDNWLRSQCVSRLKSLFELKTPRKTAETYIYLKFLLIPAGTMIQVIFSPMRHGSQAVECTTIFQVIKLYYSSFYRRTTSRLVF